VAQLWIVRPHEISDYQTDESIDNRHLNMDVPNLFSVLTLLIGLIVGHWLRGSSDSAKRRREFVIFVRTLQWDIIYGHGGFVDMKPLLIAKAEAIRKEVPNRRRQAFDELVGFISRFDPSNLCADDGRTKLAVTLEKLIASVYVA
jgi:hypothetical protein